MSIYRPDAKVDSAQADIVSGLSDRGIDVWSIRKPCDLLVRFWCVRHQGHCWQTLEVKTAYGKKFPKARKRNDQEKQQRFLEYSQTPVVISVDDAIRKLNSLHRLGGIDIPCVLKTIPATV